MVKPFDQIFVDDRKLRDYCLCETHMLGRHKARVFRSRLGLTGRDHALLRAALIRAVEDDPDQLRCVGTQAYGLLYELDFTMWNGDRHALIRSKWIVRTGETVLKLVTCYVA